MNRATPVQASLLLVPGRTPNPPAALAITGTLDGGAGSAWSDTLLPLPDGGYATVNPLPASVEGRWDLQVAWVDGGPVGSGSTVVDLSGPELRLSWPPPPPRVTHPGGADFRDPTDPPDGGRGWRRSEVIRVTVQSDSQDLDPASLRVALGATTVLGSVVGCGPDGGLTDAGFCRVVSIRTADAPMSSLRAQLPVGASATDDLGNRSDVDAGVVSLSRWAFAFDGGSNQNGFSLSPAGLLVVANSVARSVAALSPSGQFAWSRSLVYAPTRDVALGENGAVFVVEQAGTLSRGAAFDTSTGGDLSGWAPELTRQSEILGPLVAFRSGESSVAGVVGASGEEAAALWGRYVGGALSGSGSVPGSRLDAGMVAAVGYEGWLVATDGFGLVPFSSSRGFDQLTFGRIQVPPPTYTRLDHLIGRDGGYAGLGRAGAAFRPFIGSPSPTSFDPWGSSSSDPLSTPLFGADALFYSRRGGVSSVCRTQQATTSTVCVQQALGEQVSAMALGASTTLYVSITRAGSSVVQVRDSLTLALRDEVPLPGTSGACTSLTPTCIAGAPLLGCVDSAGVIVFVSTDARGIDTSADWPMEGHDPAKTLNVSTSLAPYACP